MQRKLLIMAVPANLLPTTPGHATNNDLGAPFDLGPEWRIVSHTLTFNLDGSAILSVLAELPDNVS